MSFEKAYNITIAHEGGYSKDPDDNGGETYMGISRIYHPYWEGWKFVDVAKANNGGSLRWNTFIKNEKLDNLVINFYRNVFWQRQHLGEIKDESLQEIIFDFTVNSGSAGVKTQRLLVNNFGKNIKIDGAIGRKTVGAINECNAEQLFNAIFELRKTHYKNLSKKNGHAKFLTGWLKRLASFKYKKVVGISTGLILLLVAGIFIAKKYINKQQPISENNQEQTV